MQYRNKNHIVRRRWPLRQRQLLQHGIWKRKPWISWALVWILRQLLFQSSRYDPRFLTKDTEGRNFPPMHVRNHRVFDCCYGYDRLAGTPLRDKERQGKRQGETRREWRERMEKGERKERERREKEVEEDQESGRWQSTTRRTL